MHLSIWADPAAAVLARAHRRISGSWVLAVALGVHCCWACTPYDPGKLKLEEPPLGQGGQSGMGGEGGASGSAGSTCIQAAEVCNRTDDDCDGHTDEDTQAGCQLIVLHAETDCVPVKEGSACVLVKCLDGYDSCDGDPTNGCEAPYCDCNPCEDAGGEDAGSEDAGD
jgi:hypothetical protein